MHPLFGALPVPYVRMRVTSGTFVARRYAYAPPRSKTTEYGRTSINNNYYYFNDYTIQLAK